MLSGRTPLLVGLLVIAAAVGFVFTFGSLDQGIDLEDAYPVYARFPDATGLVPASRVMLSGIEVGRLGEIGLDPDFPDVARVELFIRKDVKLHEGILDPEKNVWVNGATATRKQASLIGDYYVALSPGVAGPIIGPGGYIRNVEAVTGIDAVIANLEDASDAIFPKLNAITDDIQAITAGLRETIGSEGGVETLRKIREDISTTTENVAALTGELRGFLNTSIYPRGADIQAILANAGSTTETINLSAARTAERMERILERVEQTANDVSAFVRAQTGAAPGDPASGTVARAIRGLDKNMALLEGSLENVRAITAKIEQGRGTVGRLLTDDKLINDIEKVVSDLEDFTSTFSRTQIRVQFRADYFVNRGSFKSTVDISLHPSPDKYYLLQLIDDPTGKVSVRQRVTISNDPLRPPVLVEEITERSSEFKLTAQFATRWHFLTFRYGVMESSGGLGVDVTLLNDSLDFKLDAFELGRDAYPRIRLLATWEFLTHFFISAGVDDMLNASSRDYFVGLGVRFYDDDLKGILPLVPTP